LSWSAGRSRSRSWSLARSESPVPTESPVPSASPVPLLITLVSIQSSISHFIRHIATVSTPDVHTMHNDKKKTSTDKKLPRKRSSHKSYSCKRLLQPEQGCFGADGRPDGHGDGREESQQQRSQAALRRPVPKEHPSCCISGRFVRLKIRKECV